MKKIDAKKINNKLFIYNQEEYDSIKANIIFWSIINRGR